MQACKIKIKALACRAGKVKKAASQMCTHHAIPECVDGDFSLLLFGALAATVAARH